MLATLFVLSFVALTSSKIYFQDDFSGKDLNRWEQSQVKDAAERGSIGLSAGKWVTDEAVETGLKTLEDARFYHYITQFPEFSTKGKDLVFQFSVKHEQNIDCGGAYLKLHPAGIKAAEYTGDSVYNIMFGPDICGGTRRTHVIFQNKGTNHLITNDVETKSDTFTHMYTLIVKKDNTFQVLIDGAEVRAGAIEDEFTILKPKKINDPALSKPADWVDLPQMDDPEDIKPEGYDEIPKSIVDPEATKPDDWDDELDGEWEAPTIPNPEYKGPWSAKKIDNPAYKGPWEHPQIDNPEYVPDNTLYEYSIGAIGLEIWQVKAGTIFDNILVTDSLEEAEEARKKHEARKDTEAALDKIEKDKAAEEAKAAEDAKDDGADDHDDEDDDEKEDL